MIRLAVAGATGRMGKTILTLAEKDPSFKITAALEHAQNPFLGEDIRTVLGLSKTKGVLLTSQLTEALKGADVLIDFTHFSALPAHLAACSQTKTPYVIGTTALTDAMLRTVKKASSRIGIVQSPNMSIGVNLLFKLAEITSRALDEDYDIEIVEAHHRMKKDAPSGTAMKLLEVAAKARGKNIKKDTVYGRQGDTGARPKGEIGVFAVRGGDVVGDHTVFYLGSGERIELSHRASSREAFAQGALKAAKFIARRKKGLFSMQQVLGIS